ncbi:MAG: alpha-xylosidase, partial [Calditrichaeota bacterium]|nr:alpha-xylosidase [Calditrichota bacterium]
GASRLVHPVFPIGIREANGETSFFFSGALDSDEQMVGFGEKFGPLSKRHQKMLSWNSDTASTATDRTYKNIPFFMSSKGYGIFVNTGHRIHYEIGNPTFVSYSFEVEDDLLDFYWMYGPEFKAILKKYVKLTGRPEIPPLWSFGLWMSRAEYYSRKQVEAVAQGLRDRRIPADVLHLDPHWMRHRKVCDFVWNEADFPNPKEMIDHLHAQHFKISLWEQPYVSKRSDRFEELDKKGYFLKREDGSTYTLPVFDMEQAGIIDFTNPEARRWYVEQHQRLLEMGADVFKTDMGEAVPVNSVAADGRTGRELHNVYSLLYNRTVYETSRDFSEDHALVWGRSGYAGSQRYPLGWSGDSHCTWNDMAAVLRAGLSASLSGLPFWSHDIGGFQGGPPSPELYIRWAQWGLLSSHARCHGTNPREPWEFGEEAVRIFKKFDEFRYSLLPYLYSLAHEAVETGWPVVRPLMMEFQHVPVIHVWEHEYLLGRDLLVVPVLNPEGHVTYYVPPGTWLNFWTGKTVEGNRVYEETVPLDTLPIFIREDAVIPLVEPAQYVGEKPWNPLEIRVFLKNRRFFMIMDEDRKLISVLGKSENGEKRITLGKTGKRLHLTFLDEKRPTSLWLDGKSLPLTRRASSMKRAPVAWTNPSRREVHILLDGESGTHEIVLK